jgi:hypothetical protein
MKIYKLIRHRDPSGVSGLGEVAEAVEFTNGKVVVGWKIKMDVPSLVVYDCLDHAIAIHGHNGDTEFVKVTHG